MHYPASSQCLQEMFGSSPPVGNDEPLDGRQRLMMTTLSERTHEHGAALRFQ